MAENEYNHLAIEAKRSSITSYSNQISENNGKINVAYQKIGELDDAIAALVLLIEQHSDLVTSTNAINLRNGFGVQLVSCEGIAENAQSALGGRYIERVYESYVGMKAHMTDIRRLLYGEIASLKTSNISLSNSISSLNQDIATLNSL